MPIANSSAAYDWLQDERANLAAVVRLVGQGGWAWSTVRLARTVASYLESGRLPAEPVLPSDPAESPSTGVGVNF